MSLSPKDDPRTWLVPGSREVPRPPLHARLLYYDLTKSQYLLLRAMNEHAPEGALWEASPETYAETSRVSVRHQFNLIHGWDTVDKRPPGFIGPMNARHTPGFLESGVLTLVRKARRLPHPKPAAYKFNEFKLRLKPELLARLEAGVQQTLPGIRRPGEAAEETPNRQPLPTTAGNCCHDDRQPLPPQSATIADDSKAFNSRALDSKEESQKLTPSGALTNWLSIKEQLQKEFPEAKWISPIYLLRVFGDALGLVMPTNGEMVARAKSCSLLQELARAAGYSGAIIGRYPEDYELERIRVEYPDHYAALPEALRRRFESNAFPQRGAEAHNGKQQK
jgi:hypothetical protein